MIVEMQMALSNYGLESRFVWLVGETWLAAGSYALRCDKAKCRAFVGKVPATIYIWPRFRARWPPPPTVRQWRQCWGVRASEWLNTLARWQPPKAV